MSTQLLAANFIGYKIRTEFASEGSRRLIIISFPLQNKFKYEVTNDYVTQYLGSSLEEAISEYNQL